MQTKTLSVTSKIGLALLALTAISFAQDSKGAPPITAPLNSSVAVRAAGESVQLNGSVSVQATVATAADGTVTASYSCRIAGTGTGQTSGAKYLLSGASSGNTPVNASLPADIGLTCPMSVVAGNAAQQFGITLQGSLDAAGKLTAILIRDIAAL